MRLGGGRREAEAGGQEEADSTVVWLWTGPGKQIDVLATYIPVATSRRAPILR